MAASKEHPTLYVAPVLKTELKPRSNAQGKPTYPLYVRFLLGNRNTTAPLNAVLPDKGHIPIHVTESEFQLLREKWDSYSDQDDVDAFIQKMRGEEASFLSILAEIKEYINRIRGFETDTLRATFNLKNMGSRLRFMKLSFVDIYDEKLTAEVQSCLVNQGGLPKRAAGLFSNDQPFEWNFDRIAWLYSNEEVKLEEEVKRQIELLFLLKAFEYSGANGFRTVVSVYESLVLNRYVRFGIYLDDYEGQLFDSTHKLRLDLHNPFSRYISLVPPFEDKYFYISLLNSWVAETSKKYHKIIQG